MGDRLLVAVRLRLRNGELTERALARRIGMSQPHVHNVLKGQRMLTPATADRLLREFRMTVLDLVEPEEWDRWTRNRDPWPLPCRSRVPGEPSSPS
ncbi:MAG: helix-turn-helix transcriptional regulator [Bryobacteraceae bacterium]|nr:helix-turn-helix transcriptional regulator [Bryobacteraceae bacterium]